MRKVYIKDILRTVSKQKVSFISIIVISMLAVTAFLGINYGSAALKNNASAFFRKHNFRDFEITSTQLLTPEDFEEIRKTEGIADAEGLYQVPGILENAGNRTEIYVLSVTERINVPDLVEGRFPTAEDECVLESELMENNKIKVGDRIRISSSGGEKIDYLTGQEFTVTGSVIHPDHYAKGAYVPGNRYILVPAASFDKEKLEDNFIKAVAVMEKPEGMSFFDKGYGELRKKTGEKLDDLSEKRTGIRSSEIRAEAEQKIADGQKDLDEAQQKLTDGRRELDENTAKLRDGEQKLADAKQLLDDGRVQLENAQAELVSGEQKLSSSKAQLDSALALLNSAQAQFPAAQAQLESARAELESGRAQLDAGSAELEAGREQLRDGYLQAETGKTLLRNLIRDEYAEKLGEEAAAEVAWAQPVTEPDIDDPFLSIKTVYIAEDQPVPLEGDLPGFLERSLQPLLAETGNEELLPEMVSEIQSSPEYEMINSAYETQASVQLAQWEEGHKTYVEKRAEYLAGEEKYAAGYQEYLNGLAQYEAGLAEYENNRELYLTGLAQYEAGVRTFQEARAKYETGVAEYNQKLAEYADGVNQIENGKKELADAEKKYNDALAEYEDGAKKLDDAKEKLASLSPCRWVILDAEGNGGFQHAKNSAENIAKLGLTFALLFVVIGALIIYVTTGRIVEEQRQLVGTQKALGFYSREVLMKYVLFGGFATLIGIVLGNLLAFGIQYAVIYVHQPFYATGPMPFAFLPVWSLIVLLAGLAISMASAAIACYRLVRVPARELMQDKMPVIQKKREGKVKSSGRLYSRLILRNILSDKGRVAVTIISIAGCCALLMIGFTLQFGVNNAISEHFGRLVSYEERLVFSPSEDGKVLEELETILKEAKVPYAPAKTGYTGSKLNGHFDGIELCCGDLSRFFKFRDKDSGKELTLTDSGVIVQKKMAETTGISVGDTITLYDSEMNPHEARVDGICDLYFGRGVYLSEAAYRNIFGEAPVINTIYYDSDGNTELKERLSGVDGFENSQSLADIRAVYRTVARSLTLVTLVLIVAAGLMAYFILLNLINMYLSQKKRELTIMRINGFTSKEVVRYASRESFVTTALGIILGLGLGALLGYLILRFLEQPHAGFDHSVSIFSILLSAGITGIFAFAINAFGFRKVKTLSLTDISD